MHRVSEATANSKSKDWHFISGTLDVSDHCTRPLNSEDLAKDNSYLEGQKLLFKPSQNVTLKYVNVAEDNDTAHDSVEITSNLISMNNPVMPWKHY